MDPSPPSPPQPTLARSVSVHQLISPPRYVRSVSIGLSRSSTVNGSIHNKPAIILPASTNSSDGIAASAGARKTTSRPALAPRRVSVPFPGITITGGDGSGENSSTHPPPPKQRPLKRRSDSLPSFPGGTGSVLTGSNNVPRERKSMLFEYGTPCAVADLPSNPKTWTPSQLSVYLAHVLKLTPKQVQADIMRFTVKSGLTGKRFLRLRDEDLVALGINIGWCRIFSTARERLRKECLRGRIFGFGATNTDTSSSTSTSTTPTDAEPEQSQVDIMSYFLLPPKSSHDPNGNEEWKQNSWRRKEGKSSKGRVRGIAQVFENGEHGNGGHGHGDRGSSKSGELEEITRIRRSRQSSVDSEVSEASTEATARDLGDVGGVSDVESEAGSEVGDGDGRMQSESTMDWSQVEPMTLEETESLPMAFLTKDVEREILAPTPTTPSFSLPGLPESRDEEEDSFDFLGPVGTAAEAQQAGPSSNENSEVLKIHTADINHDAIATELREEADSEATSEDPPMPFANPDYQSRILSHGSAAYSAISRRKSITKSITQGSRLLMKKTHKQQMSEVSDEVSEECLSYWLDEQEQERRVQQQGSVTEDETKGSRMVKSNSVPDILEETPSADFGDLHDQKSQEGNQRHSGLLFAENEGNIITMKKGTRPRAHSNDNLGSLRFSSIRSRGSVRSKTSLSALFGQDTTAAAEKAEEEEKKGSKQKEEEEVLSFSNPGDGNMVVMSRTELEQMQARMQDLELQLAASRSSVSHSRTSTSSQTTAPGLSLTESEKTQAMSTWVRGALGEANDFAVNCRDTSWIGLGGWALAAGLGIGLVVGEAVLTKMRR